ncbi:MAG: efflux RND transporter periplasmic adaptor subunit [Gemmatimonadota bacterium]
MTSFDLRSCLRPALPAALVASIAACGGGDRQAPAGLESAVVERTDLVSTVAATGTVEPIRVIDVKSQASGEILEVAVELGDRVEQGALLVRIDPRDVQNANIEEGQIVPATREVTGGTTLLRMADLAEVQVRTLVDETDVGSVGADLPATIRVEAFPEREFTGRVLKVEPQAVVEQKSTFQNFSHNPNSRKPRASRPS